MPVAGGLPVFCVRAEVDGLGAATGNALDGSATLRNDLAAAARAGIPLEAARWAA